jgi:hypothetical protein
MTCRGGRFRRRRIFDANGPYKPDAIEIKTHNRGVITMVRRTGIALAALIVFAGAADAGIPRTLSYQGILGDSLGNPKPNGSYTLTFKLYGVPSGGTAKWTETKALQTTAGRFSTVLGDVTPLPDSLKFDQQYYLGIKLSTDANEMTPRITLTSAPYSLNAAKAETASVALNSSSVWVTAGNTVYYNSGKVGIGTATPAQRLSVQDTVSNGYAASIKNSYGDGLVVEADGSGKRGIYSRVAFGGSAAVDGDGGGIFPYPGGIGVRGNSSNNYGVAGFSDTIGTYGEGKFGVVGKTSLAVGAGVLGVTTSSLFNATGILGRATSGSGQTVGVTGESVVSGSGTGVVGRGAATGGYFEATNAAGWAGVFNGRVQANILQINGGSDLAEPFETTEEVTPEPGTVMVIDEHAHGKLTVSTTAYDRKVAGIISGAGGVKPGITLKQDGLMDGSSLVAIAGRVYCKAEASSGAIRPGDLLTTSAITGHAMKATEHDRAQGAIIGKAMTGLDSGTGLVLVLVNLQ